MSLPSSHKATKEEDEEMQDDVTEPAIGPTAPGVVTVTQPYLQLPKLASSRAESLLAKITVEQPAQPPTTEQPAQLPTTEQAVEPMAEPPAAPAAPAAQASEPSQGPVEPQEPVEVEQAMSEGELSEGELSDNME